MDPLHEKTSTIAEGLKEVGFLSPDRTPNHLIATVALVCLSLLNGLEEFPTGRFIVVTSFLTGLTLVSLWFIARTAPQEGERYVRGLRLARTLGLVSACVAFLFSWAVIDTEPLGHFIWLMVAVSIQCGVFVAYLIRSQQMLDGRTPVNMPALPSRLRRINNQQLCIVTATLMIGMSFNASVAVVDQPEEQVYDTTAHYSGLIDRAALDTVRLTLEQYSRAYNKDWFVKEKMMPPQEVLDSLWSFDVMVPAMVEHSVPRGERMQHRITVWIFRGLWAIVMALWIYQLFPGLELRVRHPAIDNSTTTSSSIAGSE